MLKVGQRGAQMSLEKRKPIEENVHLKVVFHLQINHAGDPTRVPGMSENEDVSIVMKVIRDYEILSHQEQYELRHMTVYFNFSSQVNKKTTREKKLLNITCSSIHTHTHLNRL